MLSHAAELGSREGYSAWVRKPKSCSRKAVQERGCKPSLAVSLLEVGEGAGTGFQQLNLGAVPDPDIPGPSKAERCYDRGTEEKGLEEV